MCLHPYPHSLTHTPPQPPHTQGTKGARGKRERGREGEREEERPVCGQDGLNWAQLKDVIILSVPVADVLVDVPDERAKLAP
jgi:hypothetical protein